MKDVRIVSTHTAVSTPYPLKPRWARRTMGFVFVVAVIIGVAAAVSWPVWVVIELSVSNYEEGYCEGYFDAMSSHPDVSDGVVENIENVTCTFGRDD